MTLHIDNCSDNSILEQLYYRLQFFAILDETSKQVEEECDKMSSNNCNSNRQYMEWCSWMNSRVLNNCTESDTYNSSLYNALSGTCVKQARKPCAALCPQ